MAAREAEAVARDNAERMAREAAERAAWLAGGGNRYTRLSDATGGALIRAVDVTRDDAGRITGGTLETSHGAEVPLTHAVKAFRFLKLCNASGRTWHANGHTIRVGHFTISEVRPDGFTAGCHRINWPEVARVAGELGIIDGPADDSALTPSHVAA